MLGRLMCRPKLDTETFSRSDSNRAFHSVARKLIPTDGASAASVSVGVVGISGSVEIHLPFLNCVVLGLTVELE